MRHLDAIRDLLHDIHANAYVDATRLNRADTLCSILLSSEGYQKAIAWLEQAKEERQVSEEFYNYAMNNTKHLLRERTCTYFVDNSFELKCGAPAVCGYEEIGHNEWACAMHRVDMSRRMLQISSLSEMARHIWEAVAEIET